MSGSVEGMGAGAGSRWWRTLRPVGALVLVAITSALAARAGTGSASPAELAFAGTLMGVSGPTSLTFHFKHAGAAVPCSPEAMAKDVPVDPATGAFLARISIAGCPADLFDGRAVTVDIDVGATKGVVLDQPIGAAPYAKYADQVGTSDCPVGYRRVAAARAHVVACERGHDEVVRVGDGPAAFWIDRFEASLWDPPESTPSDDGGYPATFPQNGQVTDPANLLHAVSRRDVLPSTGMTWFQANLACLAAGKRLPTGAEWLLAATGTVDPGASDGADGSCLTDNTATLDAKRKTGAAHAEALCASLWGAEDMVGNVGEWTGEWYATVGSTADPSCTICGASTFDDEFTWPGAEYGADGTKNVASAALFGGGGQPQMGLPAGALRGGHWSHGTRAGVFELNLHSSPSHHFNSVGFRCMTPR